MKTNRECKVCGKKYYFCPNCNSNLANPQPKWMINYCGEECKNVFDIAVKYNLGKIDKAEAGAALANVDLSNIDSYDSDIKDVILEVTAKKKSRKSEEVKTDDLIKIDVME